MVDRRIGEFIQIVNNHIESLEGQTHRFEMLRAMLEVALDGTFLNHPQVILHYYLIAMSELFVKASEANEASLSLLRRAITFMDE